MESKGDLQSILEAIKSSDVVENRVQLLTKLGDLHLQEKSDVNFLVECLTIFWEDFTCLDLSQCMLNKTILNVASKYLDADVSGPSVHFLALGTKASIWCGKHLKMSLMSTDESQEEEHCSTFFQLLLDYLVFSSSTFSAITKHFILGDLASILIVEKFILEQLNLVKEIISEVKKVNLFSFEVVKAAQGVIESVIKLCKEYSQAANFEVCNAEHEKEKGSVGCEETNVMNHVINIIVFTVEKLCELGLLAAKDGGNLVTVLNISWKGVVTLLQPGKLALAAKLKVANIIVTLTSLVNESLQCATKVWATSLKEAVSVTEARRTFLPVKFYLINAVKISSLFPCQAYLVYKEIALCVLMMSAFRFSLSQEKLFKIASEVMTELLEKTSFDLLNSILSSVQVKQELKHKILNCLFMHQVSTNSTTGDSVCSNSTPSLNDFFRVSCDTMDGARVLLLGRLSFFNSFLRYSVNLDEDIKLAITTKLGWFLDLIMEEEVYSSILISQVPVSYGSGKSIEFVWESMFSAILLALKAFMVVVASSLTWRNLEIFLLENFIHPHFLCWEIVMDLWCFLMRHAEINLVNGIIDKLFVVMKSLASPESVLNPDSALRKMARSTCRVLSYGIPSTADYVYKSVVNDGRNQVLSDIYVAFLLEGFPLNFLSDNLRSIAKQQIISDYYDFIESFDGKLSSASRLGVFGSPVFVLSASLQTSQVSISDTDMKTLTFLVAVIRNYRNPQDKVMKSHSRKLLSETLSIISNMKNSFASDEMGHVILELQNLFISGKTAADSQLYTCKADLTLFMAGLGHMVMSENDDSAKSSAIWELYHMLLRERHWAFVHLAVAAFGYFCARTTCNQLWRFVPQDAALAYDLASGNNACEERFMSELKVFLEKELALLTTAPCPEQLRLLVKDGLILKEIVQNTLNIRKESEGYENMEIDDGNQPNKRRKLPDVIGEGVELLQNGLKAIGDGLSQWQSNNNSEIAELRNKLLTHYSCLEDVIAELVGLTSRS